MLKILFVLPDLARCSIARQVAALARGLTARGCQTQMVALRNGAAGGLTEPEDGKSATLLGRGWPCDPRPFYRLRCAVRSFAPHVIHFWRCGHSSLSPVSLACRGAARHFVTPDYPQDAAHRAVRYSHARWLVSSQAIAASWRRAGVPSDQLDVFPPAALPIAAQPTHSDFGFPPAGLKFVLCAGRLVPKGGWREAIWSFNILHFLHPEAHLLIAGDGPQLDDLKRFTRAIGMQQNVHLLGWRKDLGNLIALSECVWSPSLVDGVPLVLLEALAAGKPVVASQQPSVIEMVTHRETALVVPPADRPALAKQTRSLLESPAVAREMGARGRELVRRHFSHEQWVERHVEAYLQAA